MSVPIIALFTRTHDEVRMSVPTTANPTIASGLRTIAARAP